MAVAAVGPVGGALAVAGVAEVLDVVGHHALDDVLDHLLQQVGVGALLDEIGECDRRLGDRGVSQRQVKVW